MRLLNCVVFTAGVECVEASTVDVLRLGWEREVDVSVHLLLQVWSLAYQRLGPSVAILFDYQLFLGKCTMLSDVDRAVVRNW